MWLIALIMAAFHVNVPGSRYCACWHSFTPELPWVLAEWLTLASHTSPNPTRVEWSLQIIPMLTWVSFAHQKTWCMLGIRKCFCQELIPVVHCIAAAKFSLIVWTDQSRENVTWQKWIGLSYRSRNFDLTQLNSFLVTPVFDKVNVHRKKGLQMWQRRH